MVTINIKLKWHHLNRNSWHHPTEMAGTIRTVVSNPKNTKLNNIKKRLEFYDQLAQELAIDGFEKIERDVTYDDTRYYRSGGVRLYYPSFFDAAPGDPAFDKLDQSEANEVLLAYVICNWKNLDFGGNYPVMIRYTNENNVTDELRGSFGVKEGFKYK